MAERDRKDDPIVNQKRVMDATVAKSEAEDEPILRVHSTPESRTRHVTHPPEAQDERTALVPDRLGQG
jgi:hypothetical protein